MSPPKKLVAALSLLLGVSLCVGSTCAYSGSSNELMIKIPCDTHTFFKTRLTSDQTMVDVEGITEISLNRRLDSVDIRHNVLRKKKENDLNIWKGKLNRHITDLPVANRDDHYHHLVNLLQSDGSGQAAHPSKLANASVMAVMPNSSYTELCPAIHTLPEGVELAQEVMDRHTHNGRLIVNSMGEPFVVSISNVNDNLSILVTFEQNNINYLYEMQEIAHQEEKSTFMLALFGVHRYKTLQSFSKKRPMTDREIFYAIKQTISKYQWFVLKNGFYLFLVFRYC